MVVLLKNAHIPFAASSDDDESIAGHILDTYNLAWSRAGGTFVSFMHEFK
jgi:hypothetical protein